MGTLIVNPYQKLWTPEFIDTALWLDANDFSTIAVQSGAVSEWRDKSGNNRHATQGIAINRPLLTANGLNNQNVITFDGGDDFLQYVMPINVPDFTYVILFKHSNDVFGLPSFGRIPRNFGIHNSVGTNGYRFYTNQSYKPVTLNSGEGLQYFVPNKWQIAVGDTQGISVTAYGNYVIYVGGDPLQSTRRLNGQIGEICLFSSILSQLDREKVEGYLAHKWGLTANLPTNHPYKIIPPYA